MHSIHPLIFLASQICVSWADSFYNGNVRCLLVDVWLHELCLSLNSIISMSCDSILSTSHLIGFGVPHKYKC